ncbi:major facilitator superfamily transporter [Apiospora phragmitis]|uniref:Major facilitator superfamily transporter n=1 Tax=Apiospora phragmitis TaxID=2905665 RepID=A0ABR1TUF1_9PEZI
MSSATATPAETGSLNHGTEPASQWPETAPQATETEKVDTKKVDLREDGTEYPNGVKLHLIMLAVCLAVFLMALDNATIATAIPKITDEFRSLPDVGWYGSAYLLTASTLQLLFGKFYTFFSVKWVYLSAIIVFELGSLICGWPKTLSPLLSGAPLPLAKRPIYSGMIGGLYGVASVAGPLLGGVFADKATWRWCFLINLPIGAVTLFVIAFFYADPQMTRPPAESFIARLERFDPIGTGDNATVPPRIMRNRSVWTSSFFGFATTAAFFVLVYYLPIWFQAVQGASAVDSGLRNLPMLISVVVASMIAGIAVTVFGYYTPFMIAATVLMSIGAGLLSTFQPGTSRAAWIGYQVIFGLGVGLGMQQPLMAVQAVLNMVDVPTGTAIIVFAQTLGGSLFVGVGQSVFTNQLVKSLAAYVPSLSPSIVLATGATNLQKSLPVGDIAGIQLAYSEALTKAFLVTVALSAISVVGCALNPWKSVKGKKIEAGLA